MSEVSMTYTKDGRTFNIIDKRRQNGKIVYYCIYCERFSEDAEMSEVGLLSDSKDGSSLIFKRDPDSLMPKTKEIWRVYLHYDGCRGWD
jgi:hypothetical protein